MPPVLRRIGQCETGMNWHHSTRDYATAFGLYRGTYATYRLRVTPRPPADPAEATPREQVAVALAVARDVGWTAWGCYRYQWVRHG